MRRDTPHMHAEHSRTACAADHRERHMHAGQHVQQTTGNAICMQDSTRSRSQGAPYARRTARAADHRERLLPGLNVADGSPAPYHPSTQPAHRREGVADVSLASIVAPQVSVVIAHKAVLALGVGVPGAGSQGRQRGKKGGVAGQEG